MADALSREACGVGTQENSTHNTSAGIYYPPNLNTLEDYKDYVDNLPNHDLPEIFCMHTNADMLQKVPFILLLRLRPCTRSFDSFHYKTNTRLQKPLHKPPHSYKSHLTNHHTATKATSQTTTQPQKPPHKPPRPVHAHSTLMTAA